MFLSWRCASAPPTLLVLIGNELGLRYPRFFPGKWRVESHLHRTSLTLSCLEARVGQIGDPLAVVSGRQSAVLRVVTLRLL